MAECRRQTMQLPAVTTYPPVEIEIVLRLTEEEACVLYSVLSKIGGSPCGPRGLMENIIIALNKAEVKIGNYKMEISTNSFSGSYLNISKGDNECSTS